MEDAGRTVGSGSGARRPPFTSTTWSGGVPGGPRRIVLWRHGRTAWNVENRAQGQADVPLDDIGVAQARAAAGRLARWGIDVVVSSDLERAVQTAEELTRATGVPYRTDPRLREVHVGIREGLTAREFRTAHPEVFDRFHADPAYTIPGAENPAEAGRRVAAVLEDLSAELAPGGLAVVVGHGAALRHGLLARFSAPDAMHHLFGGMDNCAVTVLAEHESEGWQIAQYNAADLLAGPVRNADDEAVDAGPVQ